MFEEPASEAVARIDSWERAFEQRAEQARSLAERTAELTATARSRDGLVEVTVNRDGQVASLRLDEGIRQQSAAATSRTILQTLQSAKAELMNQFAEATAETVGAGTETGRALVAALQSRLGSPSVDPGDESGQ
jgi:DNA-binding protein YbaB